MKALVFERNLARFAASRLVSATRRVGARGDHRAPAADGPGAARAPRPGWHRVHPLLAGICGSDLSTLDGRSSRYFEDLVSFPFVPGHEVVGDPSTTPTPRVVIEPVLGCVARGIDPALCGVCRGSYRRVRARRLRPPAPGLQIGLLRRHRRGLVGRRPRRPRLAAPPRARRALRRGRRDGGAHRLRRPRRARRSGRPHATPWPCSGRARWALCTVAALRHLARTGDAAGRGEVRAPATARRRARCRRRGRARPTGAGRAAQLALARDRQRTLTGGADVGRSTASAATIRWPRPSPWCGPGAAWCSWACPAGSPSTWPRSGTARWRSPAPTPTGPSDLGGLLRRTFDLAMEVVAAAALGRLVSAALPARALRGGARPRRRRPGAAVR